MNNIEDRISVPSIVLEISKATSSDLREICHLVQNTFGSNPKAEQVFGKWIKEPQYHITVTRADGQFIGIAASYLDFSPDLMKYEVFGHEAMDFLRDQKLGWFLNLAVLPEYRRKNVGWILAQEHSSWLRSQGCTVMVGSSWITGSEDNSANMFLKAGFRKLGESQEFLRGQLRGTGAVCSACKKNECDCRSLLFGASV